MTENEGVRAHFDEVAPAYDEWKRKAHYYYATLKSILAGLIPPLNEVLEIGCGTGDLLGSLSPSRGLGLDISPAMVEIARAKHPGLEFEVHDIEQSALPRRFGYVILPDLLEHVGDPHRVIENAAAMTEEDGRVIALTANPSWAPVLHTAERLHLKMPEGEHSWRSHSDIEAAASAAGLSLISFNRRLILPKRIPLLHRVNGARWASRSVDRWGLIQVAVMGRPLGRSH